MSETHPALDAARIWQRLEAQAALGPRYAGTPAHAAAQNMLYEWLAGADWRREQLFTASFFGTAVTCKNLWGHFVGELPGRILLGSHFDTRPWADNDLDPAQRHAPVPGANDGASGIALLAELAVHLASRRNRPSVDIVFFDAEDWHDIDGHEVSLGARTFVERMTPEERPDEVVIVDMVAGANLMLDVDVNCQDHLGSRDLTLALFALGQQMGLPAFSLRKESPYKWIGCDHTPFAAAGIASAILIDIDYPPWHTIHDLVDACSVDSLAQVARVVEAYVYRQNVGRGS